MRASRTAIVLPILLLGALLAVPAGAAPSFSVSSASVNPNPVAPGATATITIGVHNSGSLASGIIVDMEVYNSSNQKVFQQYTPGQTFGTGETRTYDYFWTVPANQPSGTYTVKVGVFSTGWGTLYMWNNSATTFSVGSGSGLPVAFSIGNITPSPLNIQRGGTVTISAPVTNTGQGTASGIIVMLYLRDPLGNEFPGNQQQVENQSFGPGQTRTYSFQWTAPGNATEGAYSVSFGVFSGDWSTMYAWKNGDTPFTVGTGTEPTFSVGTTSVSPTTVARGQSVTVTTHVKDTSSQPASNIIILVEINDDVGCQCNIKTQYLSGQSFSAGQTRAFSFVFQIPADLPPGRYTIDVGVFKGDWSKMYVWGFEVAAFQVQ
jgi:hypothetical protein